MKCPSCQFESIAKNFRLKNQNEIVSSIENKEPAFTLENALAVNAAPAVPRADILIKSLLVFINQILIMLLRFSYLQTKALYVIIPNYLYTYI